MLFIECQGLRRLQALVDKFSTSSPFAICPMLSHTGHGRSIYTSHRSHVHILFPNPEGRHFCCQCLQWSTSPFAIDAAGSGRIRRTPVTLLSTTSHLIFVLGVVIWRPPQIVHTANIECQLRINPTSGRTSSVRKHA